MLGMTDIVLPTNFSQRNRRALRNDQTDGVMDNLDNGIGLGS